MKNKPAFFFLLLIGLLSIHTVSAQAFFKTYQDSLNCLAVDILENEDQSVVVNNYYSWLSNGAAYSGLVKLSPLGDTLLQHKCIVYGGDTLYLSALTKESDGFFLAQAEAKDDTFYLVRFDSLLQVVKKVPVIKMNNFTPAAPSIIKLSSGTYRIILINYAQTSGQPRSKILFLDQNLKLTFQKTLDYQAILGGMIYDPINQKIVVNQTAYFDSILYYNYFTKGCVAQYDTLFRQLKIGLNQPLMAVDNNNPFSDHWADAFNSNPLFINSQQVIGTTCASLHMYIPPSNYFSLGDIVIYKHDFSVDSMVKYTQLPTVNLADLIMPTNITLANVPSGDIYSGSYSALGQNIAPDSWGFWGREQWVCMSKLDQNLQIIWQKEYKLPQEAMVLTKVLGSKDNTVFFIGYSFHSSNPQKAKPFIGKTDLWGGLVTKQQELNKSSLLIEVFPNPATDQINFKTSELTNAFLEIHDIQGKRIMDQKITFPYALSLESFPPGLYLWKIKTMDGGFQSGRWIKQ